MARILPVAEPMAFLSDVHGNVEALDAVLDDLARRGVKKIFVAGDLLLGGDAPVEVFKRLQQIDARCSRGLSDTALAQVQPEGLRPTDERERARAALFQSTREAVGELARKYLERLPEKVRIPLVDGSEIVMVHGSPADPTVEMSHDMSDEELEALVAGDPADIVVCGATHVAFQRDIDGIVRIVNVGSVGASPEGRIAHFTVISPRVDGTLVEQGWVEY